MKITMEKIILLTILISLSLNAYSHRGQTNSNGCHKREGNSGYHCHSRNYRNYGSYRYRNDPSSYDEERKIGETCGIEKIRDCNSFCNRKDWLGDGDCDSAFNCADLSFDRGDCSRFNNESSANKQSYPKACSVNEIRNCNKYCSKKEWLGDGDCDATFNCAEFSYDRGDCVVSSGEITSPTISPAETDEIRQCTDSKGNVTFSDSLCPNETKEDFVFEETLEFKAKEAADNGYLKMSESAYRKAGDYFEKAANLLPNGNDEERSEYLTLGGYAFQEAFLYEKSILLFKRALAIKEKIYSKEHPKVATALNSLAILYQTIEDYAQAKLLFERSLLILKKFFDNEHPTVRGVSENYEYLLFKMAKDTSE